MKNIKIKLTKHAKIKIAERNISLKIKGTDLFILLLPTAFDAAGSFLLPNFSSGELKFIVFLQKGDRFIYSLTPDCVLRGRDFILMQGGFYLFM